MDIASALAQVERGQAVSRRAWGDPDKIMRAATAAPSWDGEPATCAVAVGPQVFTQEDLDADDWFVVAAVN